MYRRNLGTGAATRIGLTLAALISPPTLTALAQGSVSERALKTAPGRDLRVGVYTDIRQDCTSGPLPAIRLATPPAHGAVSVKRGTLKATNLKQCLATDVPAFVAFYRAAADFRGNDQFVLEIVWPNGRRQLQSFRIDVANGVSEGI